MEKPALQYKKTIATSTLAFVLFISVCMVVAPQKTSSCKLEGVKVLAIVASGYDETEYFETVSSLEENGATFLTASFEKEELYGHQGGGPIIPNVTFAEANASEYDAFFIPGGLSPENLLTDPRNETLLILVREANDKYLILSAICHGPWVLANASVVEGKNGTGHPEVEQYWTAAGGIWTYPKMVEKDGNLLTARYEGLEEFEEALVLALQSSKSVGGIWTTPNVLELLAPWIVLTLAIILAIVAVAIFRKFRKK